MAYVVYTLLVAFFSVVHNDIVDAQSPTHWGRCPQHVPAVELDLEKFQGLWYEVERTFYVFELLAVCPRFNFTLLDDGSLEVQFFMKNRVYQDTNVYTGEVVPERKNPSVWDVRPKTSLPSMISRILPGSGKYYVLDTDYDNFAILWSCSNMGLMHSDLIWILGRDKKISPLHRSLIYSTLDSFKIDDGRLTLSKQKDCD
ncbi:hypothetical protein V9T40_011572 [Parthenolecanium corni]|uniref:Lipocalin/cytosolic fatty-acid binding domain-containing protein n=1 Tax=Parthenolecanium corni TaxID=536013 RepID=A0AAN9TKV3_9HEMI